MKNSLLLFVFLSLVLTGLKGQTISYTYDETGNRIARNENGARSAEVKTSLDETKTEITLRIYPNPVRDILVVETNAVSETDKAHIYLSDAGGKQVMSGEISSGKWDIDLGSYPSGVYILKLIYGEKTLYHKVIKE